MVVPLIGLDSIVIVPFTNRTRSRMLVRPRPLPCDAASTSNPLPESFTKTGRETPRRDLELIKQRLREAELIAREMKP